MTPADSSRTLPLHNHSISEHIDVHHESNRMLPSTQSISIRTYGVTYITQLDDVWMIVSHQNLDLFIWISFLWINHLNTFLTNINTKQQTHAHRHTQYMHAVLLYNGRLKLPGAAKNVSPKVACHFLSNCLEF